jgi:hypothetical protein
MELACIRKRTDHEARKTSLVQITHWSKLNTNHVLKHKKLGSKKLQSDREFERLKIPDFQIECQNDSAINDFGE